MELAILVPLFFAALFGWWGAAIMRGKCRPIALGIILGGTLGIFGIIILWLIPADQRALWERQQQWAQER